jgi:hypothetical protein
MKTHHLGFKVTPFLLEAFAESHALRFSEFPTTSSVLKALMLSGIIGKADLSIAEWVQRMPYHAQDDVYLAVRTSLATGADPITAIAHTFALHGLARKRVTSFPVELTERLMSSPTPCTRNAQFLQVSPARP